MDYPYLVNALNNNIKTISKLKDETEEILMHIGNKAVIRSGRFTQQPDPKKIVPLDSRSQEFNIIKSVKKKENINNKKGGNKKTRKRK